MYVNDAECEAAGLDPREVERIAKGLSKYAKQAEALGIQVFGGTGSGSLRFNDGGSGKLIVAHLAGDFDGGDGGSGPSGDGLERGET
jgi:hypothetical protein|tara:strand:- start:778 stop:1038 length:261 start_codon:yes stop_codon:yes gene_type:complete